MRDRWTTPQAWEWWDAQRWIVGVNFTPSSACNQLEMWQAATFDLPTIERELGWAADLGFTTVRTYLHDLLWSESSAWLDRVDAFLTAAADRGIRPILVLFDDVWNDGAALGPQPEPHPGRHNSRWLQSPGVRALRDYDDHRDRLETYVRGVVGAFRADGRVLAWDVYNEPGGVEAPSGRAVDALCLPLLTDVFVWVREQGPVQPLTSGTFSIGLPLDPRIRELQLAQSDIVSFHHYGPVDDLERVITELADETGRPLLCTEYMARTQGSRFETHLPVFEQHRVGAISWGLVAGRTQTHYPWSSWGDDVPAPEPTVWFHDILRSDGSPFDPKETAFLRTTLHR